jgi:hypothetical protein
MRFFHGTSLIHFYVNCEKKIYFPSLAKFKMCNNHLPKPNHIDYHCNCLYFYFYFILFWHYVNYLSLELSKKPTKVFDFNGEFST